MPILHLLILALIQGLTEFIPVSSSGHLVLAHAALDGGSDWDQDLLMDVAVHVGTLLSVLVYFWQDVLRMICGCLKLCFGDRTHEGSRLFLWVILGSIPVIIAGFLLKMWEPSWLRSVQVMAWSTILFGIVLWWVDTKRLTDKTVEDLNIKNVIGIGVAQILALIPGTSRSGITMTAARWFGFSRTEAARYSLLLAIVAISGAGTLSGLDLYESGDLGLTRDVMIACGLSFIAGFIAIGAMMKFLERSTFTVFAIYRVILGVAVLGLFYAGLL